MIYVQFESGVVSNILYDNDPSFPDFSVKQRVPTSYFAKLTPVEEGTIVNVGWRQNEDGTFEEVPQEDTPAVNPQPELPTATVRQVLNDTDALVIDHEYRLTLLELGVI